MRVIGIFVSVLFFILLLFLFFSALAPGYMLAPIARLLVVDEVPAEADGIVVLLGGGPDRVKKANELYRTGVGHKIIFGSGFVDRNLIKSDRELTICGGSGVGYEVSLRKLGIKREELQVIDTSIGFDTSGELTQIAAFGKVAKWKRIILVTSALHTARVYWIWKRVGRGIPAIVVAGEDPDIDIWWKIPRARKAVIYELLAFVKESVRRVFPDPDDEYYAGHPKEVALDELCGAI